MGKVLYRFRWLIGAGVILLAVAFGLSGSSIGMWAEYLPGCTDTGLLAGTPRSIRADEWAVSTVCSFAQTYDGEFQYFSDVLRGTDTDMVLASNAPVLDPVAVTRLFSMGYVLFGIDGGLAFFWVSRLVVLFLVTFEFLMLLTERQKGWSLAGTLLITFSGAVQWWFHTSALLECTVYGELAVLILRRYFYARKLWKKLLYAVGMGLLGFSYTLALYPAWQVPLVYVFLAVLVWQLLELKEEGVLKPGIQDGGCVLLAAGVCACGVLYFFSRSASGIAAVNNTVYPGTRFVTGGGLGLEFFQYANSIFYPLVQEGVAYNVCEQAMFFDFFPLGILLAVWQLVKRKKSGMKSDSLLIGLLAVNLFFFFFCAAGFPDFLARWTFLSNCPTTRVLVIFGYANVLILIRCLAMKNRVLFEITAEKPEAQSAAEKSEKQNVTDRPGKQGVTEKSGKQNPMGMSAIAAAVFALAVGLLACLCENEYVTPWMAGIEIAALFCLGFALLRGWEKGFALLCAGLAVFTGLLVNPVQKGADFIYENPLVQAIARVNEEQEGVWMTDCLSYPMNNVPLFVGASTINSTSYYPDLERWRLLNPGKQWEIYYNRFAHIRMELVETGISWFEQGEAGDRLNVFLDIRDIGKMGVNYVLSVNDLEVYNREGLTFTLLEQVEEYRIYQVDAE